MGDYNGIGPEIILKALAQMDLSRVAPLILGHIQVFEFYAERLDLSLEAFHRITSVNNMEAGKINLLECVDEKPAIKPGKITDQAGRAAMQAIETGIELCLRGETQALVTAPISKEAVNRAGYNIPGHTEFLAEKSGVEDFMMLLVYKSLRVGLVTTHIPVRDIPRFITKENILSSLKTMNRVLKNDFDMARPHIAVLGLNPHAGDGGVIGTEETEQIAPAVEQAQKDEIEASGPFPADGFFGNKKYEQFDGVLAMYHDQGLAPFKTISFGGGVNVTGGLPFIRTSPDHGTAFDIAGKGKGDISSFLAAYKLAVKLSGG